MLASYRVKTHTALPVDMIDAASCCVDPTCAFASLLRASWLVPTVCAVQVLMPGFDAKRAAANPFHPRFVKLLEGFGVLRFMGWMEANTDAVPRTWAERAKPTDRYAQGGQGIGLYYICSFPSKRQ